MNLNIFKNERFLLLVAVFLVFIALASIGRFGPNPSSRFMLTKDIVLYQQLTLNKADVDFYSGLDYSILNGKYFSDKPPGFSFLTIPLYAAGNFLYTNGINLPRTDSFNYGGDANSFFLMVVFVVFISALGSLRFYDVLRLLKFTKKVSLATTIIFSFATLYLVYSYNLFLHSFVATLLIFATYHFLKNKKYDLLYAGAFFGFAILCEYEVILILPLFVLYLSRLKNFRKNFLYFALPIIFSLGLLGLYNWAAFGSPFIFSYQISTFKDTQKFDHPLFQGLYELLISNWRGLFFYNPIFLLSILGFFLLKKDYEKESYLFILIFLVYLFFFATYRYLSGGLAFGPRHLVSILPFLGFLIAPCLDRNYFEKIKEIGMNEKFYFSIVLILLAVSVFHTFLGIYVTPQSAPEIDLNPIYNYSWMFVMRGDKNSFLQMHYPQLYFLFLIAALLIFVKLLKKSGENEKQN